MQANLNQAVLAAMAQYAEATCLQVRHGVRYEAVQYQTIEAQALRLMKFFKSQALPTGARVVIVADNSPHWLSTYLATLFAGAVAVPLHGSLAPGTLLDIVRDCEASVILLQSDEHIKAIAAAKAELPHLTIRLVADAASLAPGMLAITYVLSEIDPLTPDEAKAFRIEASQIPNETLAMLMYGPSPDGQPLGAMFEQRQLWLSLRQLRDWFLFDDDEVAFTPRPWSEFANLLVSLHYFIFSVPNVLPESFETINENMQQTSPTVMLTVPRGPEVTYEQWMARLSQEPEATKEVFQWALAKGREYRAAGADASPELQQAYMRADMTFFNQIRGEMGGRMRRLYSTSASLPREISEFYEAIGLQILDLYSVARAGGFAAVSTPDARRAGASGRVTEPFACQIAADDEVLLKGPTLMRGYWQNPEASQAALTEDGWLRTGDIGYLDNDNYLYITERKRYVMVMSTGRKIAPMAIEALLMDSPYITQAAIIGEGRSYLSAMIVPDIKRLAEHFREVVDDEGNPIATTTHPKVKALLEQVIGEVNQKLDRWEYVREYSLLDQPLSQDAGELTASMKISRHVVASRYASQIAAMYPVKLQLEAKEVSEVQLDPERLRELLEKESILDAWLSDAGIGFLFDLAHEKQVDKPSMVNICDAAATIAQMENEEKPLSTALIVGDPIKINRVLPASHIQLTQHDHIRRMRKILVMMAKMVDGVVLGYVVDKYGYVRGVSRLEVDLDEPDSFLGPQFRRHAAISRECDALVFYVPKGGRQVRVFANGDLVGRYANGDWVPEAVASTRTIISDLVRQRQYDRALVERVLRCAFRMSEENLGAIFVLGDSNLIFERSDASEISSFAAITSAAIDTLSDRELVNFAKQDGATVIDTEGKFRGCMVLLRPDAGTQAEIGAGKGARHSSAAKMSAEAECIAITVSQDGPITVYESGRKVLSL